VSTVHNPTEDRGPAPAARLREPYVGEGVDGCLRSAWIDREEADCLDLSDARHAEVLSSAERWEQQAEQLAGQAARLRRPEAERRGVSGVDPGPRGGVGR
jgi:hypothetical protein